MQRKNLNFLRAMETTPSYEYHPLANLFPLMAEAEIDELAENIRVNGLTYPIVLYEDKILDGRNRYLACQQAGVTPEFSEFSGDDPIQFVLSVNLHRRHLTIAQRAEIADKLATLPQGARTDLASNESRLSQQQAADAMQVSRSSVGRARAARRRREAAKFESPSESNGDHDEEATNNVTPFSDERSRPISDEEKWVRQFKHLVKYLSEEFKKPPVQIRACIRDYLADHR